MAFSKDFSGLGFTETRKMNIALLAKWIIKIESDDKSLCIELLRRKYLVHGGLFQHKGGNVSQFWRGLLNIKRWMSFGSEWVLGNGESIDRRDVGGALSFKTLFHADLGPSASSRRLHGESEIFDSSAPSQDLQEGTVESARREFDPVVTAKRSEKCRHYRFAIGLGEKLSATKRRGLKEHAPYAPDTELGAPQGTRAPLRFGGAK